MRQGIESQPETLRSYRKTLLAIPKSSDPSRIVFAGSGDSYSAALWAQELSAGKAIAHDPFELALEPSRAKDKDVMILSVSGKTRANIFLAKKLKGVARRRIAVTGSKDSPLSRECDDTLLLEYHRTEGLTAGTASYTSTLLVCSRLLGQIPVLNFEHTLKSARVRAERTDLSPRKDTVVVFVGAGLDYPLAMYGGLKLNEVLGMKTIYCSPEQLVHAILFSLDKKQDRIVMIDPESNRRHREIKQTLSDVGFHLYSVDVPPRHPVKRSLEIAFHLQYLAYNRAVNIGLKECAFLSNKEILDVSSRLIY